MNLKQRRKSQQLPRNSRSLQDLRRINNSLRNNYRRIADRKKKSLTQRNQTSLARKKSLRESSQESWKAQCQNQMKIVFQRPMMRSLNLSPTLKIRALLTKNLWRLISRLTRLASSILIKIKWWLTRSQMTKMA